ncbi:GtrA family protein [uncultured Jatrophihabitans sp.]|uniref:GtrA family protein n=1 Tax=uncultured Jatrophihabitans sp. TaxID=1610747 RepID=UPI0035CAC955
MRLLVREGLAFSGVGAAAFVVQLAVLNLLVHRGIGPLGANATAMVVSCAVAYAGNRWLSFRHRRREHLYREAVAFVLVNAITLVIGELVLATAYLGHAQRDPALVNVLSIVGIGLGTMMRFWAYRSFVFTEPAVSSSVGASTTPTAADGAVALAVAET